MTSFQRHNDGLNASKQSLDLKSKKNFERVDSIVDLCQKSINDKYETVLGPMRAIKKSQATMSKALIRLKEVSDVARYDDLDKSVQEIIDDMRKWKENNRENFLQKQQLLGQGVLSQKEMLK